jgi:hypothetical protein
MKKDIPQLAMIIGTIMLFLSLIWWQQTYGVKVDYFKCFVFSGGVCRVSAIGMIFGGAGYSPVTFWIGLISLGTGLVLRKSRLM